MKQLAVEIAQVEDHCREELKVLKTNQRLISVLPPVNIFGLQTVITEAPSFLNRSEDLRQYSLTLVYECRQLNEMLKMRELYKVTNSAMTNYLKLLAAVLGQRITKELPF